VLAREPQWGEGVCNPQQRNSEPKAEVAPVVAASRSEDPFQILQSPGLFQKNLSFPLAVTPHLPLFFLRAKKFPQLPPNQPFCRSAVLPFCRSAVLPFCRSGLLEQFLYQFFPQSQLLVRNSRSNRVCFLILGLSNTSQAGNTTSKFS
jgi:hypothetical protein